MHSDEKGPALCLARSEKHYADALRLFSEYAMSLGFDLDFQDFEREKQEIRRIYAPPEGRLFLAYLQGTAAGCVALKPFSPGIGEIKRLYVQPPFRGRGLGRALALAVIQAAEEAGYRLLRLDTIDSMVGAISLYRSLGFREIPAYRANPVAGATFFELSLEEPFSGE